jgi:hypothetical protein
MASRRWSAKDIDKLVKGQPVSKSQGRIKANKHEYAGLRFDSTLELDVYKVFLSYGLDFDVKPSFVLFEESLLEGGIKVPAVRFTPDFLVSNEIYPDRSLLVDAKGWATDEFILRWKTFSHLYNRPVAMIRSVKEAETLALSVKLKSFDLNFYERICEFPKKGRAKKPRAGFKC